MVLQAMVRRTLLYGMYNAHGGSKLWVARAINKVQINLYVHLYCTLAHSWHTCMHLGYVVSRLCKHHGSLETRET
jgi:hypothetical protein